MKAEEAVVPGIWSLEVANVLARTEAQALGTEARSEAFVDMLQRMDIAIDGVTSAQALGGTLQLARGSDCRV